MGKIQDKSMQDILSRSTAEKILLVEAIWDNIAEESKSIPIDAEQLNLVKERVVAYKKNPSKVKPWEEVKKNYLKKK
ncbi:MAG: addiction module protein [Bacteroidia bacterium]